MFSVFSDDASSSPLHVLWFMRVCSSQFIVVCLVHIYSWFLHLCSASLFCSGVLQQHFCCSTVLSLAFSGLYEEKVLSEARALVYVI